MARDGQLDLSGVVYAISGAMTLTPAVVKRWEDLAGSMLNEGYGLTETSPVALANPFGPPAAPFAYRSAGLAEKSAAIVGYLQ